MRESICLWDDCGETLYSNGTANRKYCDTHKKSVRAVAGKRLRQTNEKTCTLDGCERPHRAKGMCAMHYRRWERANGTAKPPSDTWGPRRRANWYKRHAILRGALIAETIYDDSIFRRDSYICGICNEPVDKTLKTPHPRSASLDHRIPLVLHGSHTRQRSVQSPSVQPAQGRDSHSNKPSISCLTLKG